MKGRSVRNEPPSTALSRYPQGDRTEINSTIRWVGFSAFAVFLTLIITGLILGNYLNVLVISIGIVPIIISMVQLKREAITFPTTMLSATTILLITWMASQGQGINDIGVLGYPVILIVAGLVLRGRTVLYLSFLVIACMGWLVFGNISGLYDVHAISKANMEDFFIGGVIILVASHTIYRLAKNVYTSLYKAEQEIEMRKQVEQDREAVIRQLKAKNQELDRFAIRVSHDLKTPLITLAGFLGYLEKDIQKGDAERAEKDFAQVRDAAKQMGLFVDELLDLSRVGRIANPPTDVPFAEIVREALKVTDGILRAKQVQVEVDATFPVVHVDRARIIQAMQNLITNAVKFMGDQPEPKIKIGSTEFNDEHIFSVSDNGIGIAPEYHETIFELFNKLNPEVEGTGLGLGLVKKIVEVHGGRIWVESKLGKGSTFMFTLRVTPKIEN